MLHQQTGWPKSRRTGPSAIRTSSEARHVRGRVLRLGRYGVGAFFLWLGAGSGEGPAAWNTSPEVPIRIGLFVPGRGPGALEGEAVRNAVQLAVEEVNAGGGFRGRPFEVVERASDEAWGRGTGELADLIFQNGTMAVLGALDGKSAHLAAQVVTRAKGEVLFITPWTSDATLTQIGIPWFLRALPDDRSQALALAQRIFGCGEPVRAVVALSSDDPASVDMASAFTRAASSPPVLVHYSGSAAGREVASRLREEEAEALVLVGPPAPAGTLVGQIRRLGVKTPVFGTLHLASPEFLEAAGEAAEGTILVAPFLRLSPLDAAPHDYQSFARRYRQVSGRPAGALAAFAYDSARSLLQAILETGPDPRRVRQVLSRDSWKGVTGLILYDEQGNRLGTPALAVVRDGKLEILQDP